MLDHVSITVSDLDRAACFYDAIAAALGRPCVYREPGRIGYGGRGSADDDAHTYLSIVLAPEPAGPVRHWALRADDRAAVDAFHAAGLTAGGREDGSPGPRPEYHEHYYAAFLLDPDGNRVEAVCHRRP